jgi:hypothetical protein
MASNHPCNGPAGKQLVTAERAWPRVIEASAVMPLSRHLGVALDSKNRVVAIYETLVMH